MSFLARIAAILAAVESWVPRIESIIKAVEDVIGTAGSTTAK